MQGLIEFIKYVILGILQGISEILPISSSGHLMVAQHLLKLDTNNIATMTILLHFASLLALLLFFRKTLIQMTKGIWSFIILRKKEYKEDFMLFIYLIIASIPVGIVGVLFEDKIDTLFSNLLFVGICFVFTAFVLFLISKIKNNNQEKISFRSAIVTGIFQLIGIFPGISRSGMTLSGATISGLEQKKAKEFAFLLFIPVALGSFVFSLDNAYQLLHANFSLIFYSFVAMVITFIFTYLSLQFILNKFNDKHYRYFAIYLVFAGILTIILAR